MQLLLRKTTPCHRIPVPELMTRPMISDSRIGLRIADLGAAVEMAAVVVADGMAETVVRAGKDGKAAVRRSQMMRVQTVPARNRVR